MHPTAPSRLSLGKLWSCDRRRHSSWRRAFLLCCTLRFPRPSAFRIICLCYPKEKPSPLRTKIRTALCWGELWNHGPLCISLWKAGASHASRLQKFGTSSRTSRPWGLWITVNPLQSFPFPGLFCLQPTARSLWGERSYFTAVLSGDQDTSRLGSERFTHHQKSIAWSPVSQGKACDFRMCARPPNSRSPSTGKSLRSRQVIECFPSKFTRRLRGKLCGTWFSC